MVPNKPAIRLPNLIPLPHVRTDRAEVNSQIKQEITIIGEHKIQQKCSGIVVNHKRVYQRTQKMETNALIFLNDGRDFSQWSI